MAWLQKPASSEQAEGQGTGKAHSGKRSRRKKGRAGVAAETPSDAVGASAGDVLELARRLGPQTRLPAAEDALGTWIHGFRFELMSDEELKQARTDLKVLVFPGTRMLKKAVEDDPLETPWIPTEFHLPAQRKRPLRTLQIDDEED